MIETRTWETAWLRIEGETAAADPDFARVRGTMVPRGLDVELTTYRLHDQPDECLDDYTVRLTNADGQTVGEGWGTSPAEALLDALRTRNGQTGHLSGLLVPS